jgi:TRAP-type C4-dicarboxylate transport system permease small subunit
MSSFRNFIFTTSDMFNWVAAGAIAAMMFITCVDVVLRFFRHPIPGAYEMVGLMGTVVISFSLARTTAEKGHIAVEFLVRKFSLKAQHIVNAANGLLGILIFGIISWQGVIYALDLKASGEVSMTIQMPIYPFVFGISIGCGLTCVVLAIEFFKSIKKAIKK